MIVDDTVCKSTTEGKEYIGQISETANGTACQRWDSQSPHSHNYTTNDYYPDATITDAANHCRNVDDEDLPWCYTTDPDVRWEYCNIPDCSSMYFAS